MGDYIVGAANSAACAPESAALASADACKNASAMLDLVYAGTKDDPAMPSGCFKQARRHAPLCSVLGLRPSRGTRRMAASLVLWARALEEVCLELLQARVLQIDASAAAARVWREGHGEQRRA